MIRKYIFVTKKKHSFKKKKYVSYMKLEETYNDVSLSNKIVRLF